MKKIAVLGALLVGLAIERTGLLDTAQAQAAEVSGIAKVTDGDSLRLQGKKIRLFGIDAPESRQRCTNSQAQSYRCGDVSRDALRAMTQGQRIRCIRRDVDRYGRWVSDCFAGKTHLNHQMVLQGHAMAYRRFSTQQVDAETQAKAARRGLWQGSFTPPWDWRRQNR